MSKAPPKKPKRSQKALIFFLSLILLMGAFFFSLPSIVSTDWGKEKTVSLLNGYIPGKLQINQLHLSWFGAQRIEGIRLIDPENKEVMHVEEVSTSASLWQLLLQKDFTEYKSKLKGFNATLVDEGNGVTNLQRAISSQYSKLPPSPQFEIVLADVNGSLHPGASNGILRFELSGSTLKNGVEGTFDIAAKLNGKDIFQLMEGRSSGEDIQLSVKIDRFPVLIIDQLASIFQPELQGVLLEILGDQINIEIDQNLHNGKLAFQLNAQSPSFSAALPGMFEDGKLCLDGSGEIHAEISPSLIQRKSPNLHLAKSFPIKIILDNLEATAPFDLSKFAIQGKVEVGAIQLLAAEIQESLSLQGIQGEFSYPFSQNGTFLTLTLNDIGSEQLRMPALKLVMDQNETLVSIPELHYRLDKANTDEGYALSFSNIGLSLDPFEMLSQWKNVASLITKGTFSFQRLTLEKENGIKSATVINGTIPWEIHSPKGEIRVGINGKTYLPQSDLDGGFNGSFLFTNWMRDRHPDFSHVHIDGHMLLSQVPTAFLSVGAIDAGKLLGPTLDLEMRVVGKMKPDILSSSGSFDLTFNTPELAGSASLKAAKLIEFKIDSQSKSLGTLLINGSVDQLWTSDGKLNTSDLVLQLEGSAHNFPVGALGIVSANDPALVEKAEAILGSTVDANIHAQLKHLDGPIRAEMRGQNGSVLLDGTVSHGVLTLNNDLTAQFNLTPKVSQAVLGKVIPILGDILSSDRAIALHIEKEGFSLPLVPFSIPNIHLAKGSVDIGKVTFASEGKLGGMVKFLNAAKGNVIPIWCTPVYFSLNEGILAVSRFDLLLMGRYPFALWGKINFPKDKTDLILGISGKTIAEAFGIKHLPGDLLVQVPLKGTVANPSLDIKKATAKITAIAAQEQGTKGKLIGSILNIAANGLKEETPPPQPTTMPLPWQNLYEDTAEAEPSGSGIQDLILDPIKEVEKGAQNLIKGLLKG